MRGEAGVCGPRLELRLSRGTRPLHAPKQRRLRLPQADEIHSARLRRAEHDVVGIERRERLSNLAPLDAGAIGADDHGATGAVGEVTGERLHQTLAESAAALRSQFHAPEAVEPFAHEGPLGGWREPDDGAVSRARDAGDDAATDLPVYFCGRGGADIFSEPRLHAAGDGSLCEDAEGTHSAGLSRPSSRRRGTAQPGPW